MSHNHEIDQDDIRRDDMIADAREASWAESRREREGGDVPGICPSCSGSGEGMYDGSTCRTCHGRGES